MKNSNIKQIAFMAVTGLFLSACGGGGGSDSVIAQNQDVKTGQFSDGSQSVRIGDFVQYH